MEEKTTTFELHEPVSPETLVPAFPVDTWVMVTGGIVFILLILALIAAILYFRKKASAPPTPQAIRETARAEAEAALNAIGPDTPSREAAVISSLVLRKYLSVVAADPALFETHEEYISREKALEKFTDEARQTAATGFSRLASIKYAAAQPDLNTEQVITGSRTLLQTLHQGLKP